jgi:hypothetical protein
MKTVETRIDFFKKHPGMVMAELGVFMGHFSRELMLCNPKRLILVDIWEGPMSSGINDDDKQIIRIPDMSVVYIDIMREFEFSTPNVHVMRMRSTDFLSDIDDNCLDCVYIDTDHAFEQTRNELNLSREKVKPGGWITGHDYNISSVQVAVDSFCQLNNLQINYLSKDKFISYYIKNLK